MENVTLPTSWGITTDQEARLEGIGGRISIHIVSLSISIPSRIRIKRQKERRSVLSNIVPHTLVYTSKGLYLERLKAHKNCGSFRLSKDFHISTLV